MPVNTIVPLVNVQTLLGVVLLCICMCLYRVYAVGFNQASLIYLSPIARSSSFFFWCLSTDNTLLIIAKKKLNRMSFVFIRFVFFSFFYFFILIIITHKWSRVITFYTEKKCERMLNKVKRICLFVTYICDAYWSFKKWH
jgi:hypothetical protein